MRHAPSPQPLCKMLITTHKTNMKKTILFIALTVIIQSVVSQSCLPDGIIFSTQAEIDSFQINYPGCTEIEGDVMIKGSDIVDLHGLFMLTSIGGDLNIQFNPNINNLIGLNNLTTINKSLRIYFNDSLTTLDGLNNLNSIGGDLWIGDVYYSVGSLLTSLESLSNLNSINGSLCVRYCNSLSSLAGLENINSGSITEINIYNNSSLSSCEVQSICNFLGNPTGVINIYNNAEGCNNPSEIADECGITMDCLPFGNYYCLSQQEINNFQSNYPSCDAIQGNIMIRGDNITNLNGLNNIISCSGNLNIGLWYGGTDSLVDLTGLNNIISIGGDLTVSANNMLISLTGLNNLDSVGGKLEISNNYQLTSLTGLNSLNFIGGSLVISNTNYLKDLTGLNNVNNIGENINIYDNSRLRDLSGLENISTIPLDLDINYNDSLVSLTGLQNVSIIGGGVNIDHMYGSYLFPSSNLTEIGGNLQLMYNENLANLSGLENLTSIAGDLNIRGNQSLTSISELDNLNKIVGELKIEYNPSLTSLYGLNHLNNDSLNKITICNNDSLSNCDAISICNYLSNPTGSVNIYKNAPGCNTPPEIANDCNFILPCLPFGNYYFYNQSDIDNFQIDYQNCNELKGSVYIRSNGILNLNGLTPISSIENGLSITNCHNLTNLIGLENLNSVGDRFLIFQNFELESTDGLANLNLIGGSLEIGNNEELHEINSFNQLTFIGKDLNIDYNRILHNISGFSLLDSIGGNFDININDYVRNLSSFSNLKSVGGRLKIKGNKRFNSLIGLEKLTTIGGDLYIAGSDSLTSLSGIDNIESNSINDLTIRRNKSLSTCNIESICNYLISPGGEITIEENSVGCNSELQILQACTIGVSESISSSPFTIYPNPTKSRITISAENEITINEVIIYNQLGQKVFYQKAITNKIDISKLGQGLYIIELVTDKNIVREKLIIK